jgi:glutamate synthase (NADPH/NADH) small chain
VQPIKPRPRAARERRHRRRRAAASPPPSSFGRKGYQVTIYDRYDRVGGLLIYGIPNFKLEKDIVQRREKLLRESKVTFELNCEVGRDVTMDSCAPATAAVLIANRRPTRRATSQRRASA